MHQGVAKQAHLLLELIAVIGGDHQHRYGPVAAGVDRRYRLDAGAVMVQVIIGDQQVDPRPWQGDLTLQVRFTGRRGDLAAPLFEQAAHAGADRPVVIQHPDPRILQRLQLRHVLLQH